MAKQPEHKTMFLWSRKGCEFESHWGFIQSWWWYDLFLVVVEVKTLVNCDKKQLELGRWPIVKITNHINRKYKEN